VRVLNVRNMGGDYEDAVYIGRANPKYRLVASKWANPFAVGRDGTRDEVVEKYRQHLIESPDLIASLPELVGKDLVCWCAPKRCHGDVLKVAVEGIDLS
jgi:Domain of unknown function (DUF4326)